ncbi:MAG: protein kinase [Elusimicrobiota bacterium]
MPIAALLTALLTAAAAGVSGGAFDDSNTYTEQARAALRAGDLQSAVDRTGQALELYPRNAEAYRVRASAFNAQERYSEAEIAAHASLRLEPRSSYANNELAWALLHLRRYAEAAESASRSISGRPDGAQAYALRAMAHEGLGLGKESLADLQKAADLDPLRHGQSLQIVREGGSLLGAGKRQVSEAAYAVGAAALVLVAFVLWALFRKSASAARQKEEAAVEVRAPPPPGLEAGGLIAGRYQLVHIIGRGGMGQVWEARDTSLDRPVAVKEFSRELGERGSQLRGLFVQEAKTVAALKHRHIADIYEILDSPEGLYMIFEFVRGRTVQHILAERKTLPVPEILTVLRPVCEALEYAHQHGVVHRDLKPSNIMVDEQGFIKLLDFGIARHLGAAVEQESAGAAVPGASPLRLAHTRTVVGTPGYMPPEAAAGIISPAADVYALGVCFYEMLTGNIPPSPFPGGVSPGVDALMARCVHPDYRSRIHSAGEFRAMLERLA